MAGLLTVAPSPIPNLLTDPEADLPFILSAAPRHTEALRTPSEQRLLQWARAGAGWA